MRRGWTYVIAGATLLFLGAFLVWPLIQVLRGGFSHKGAFTMAFVAEVFRNPIYLEGFLNSLCMALATSAMVALIGLPLAVLAARCDFPGKSLLSGLILAPMILPPFVGAIGVRQILGRYGALNALLVRLQFMDWSDAFDWIGGGRFWAIAVTEALHLYPIFYLNAVAAISNVDPAMEEAAENLGCFGLRRFFRITAPLIMPGIFAGMTIVFIWSFTELGTPLMFDYSRITAVQIYDGIKDIGASPFPYALVLIMLVISIALYGAGKFLFGRSAHGMMAKAGQAASTRRLTGWRGLLACGVFALVFAVAALPHLGVLLTSLGSAWYKTILPSAWTGDHYMLALGHGMTLPSIQNSLQYSSLAMMLDLCLGVGIAYVVVRSDLSWRGALDTLAMLPLAVPGVIVAFGYVAMSRPGTFFAFMDPTDNPMMLLVVAYAVRRLPYVVRSAVAGLQQTSVTLEEAALNLGCPPARAVFRITLPLIHANLIAGGLLAFSFAMLEVSDSLILAQKQAFFPITKALYELFQLLGEGKFIASALGIWAMLFLLITILGANSLLGKRLGAIFRV